MLMYICKKHIYLEKKNIIYILIGIIIIISCVCANVIVYIKGEMWLCAIKGDANVIVCN